MPRNRNVGPAIPGPRADRYPLKTNVFSFVQGSNSQLAPLFPYLDAGSLVPCIAYLRGDTDDYGYFLHSNSVDEIVLCFGSRNGRLRTGQVAVGARTHPVAGPSGVEQEAESYYLMVLTQRQSTQSPQHESIVFICKSCQAELYRLDFDVNLHPTRRNPILETIEGSEAAACTFNAADFNRTCAQCGHENSPFPKHKWGWQQQIRNAWIGEQGREALAQAASSA